MLKHLWRLTEIYSIPQTSGFQKCPSLQASKAQCFSKQLSFGLTGDPSCGFANKESLESLYGVFLGQNLQFYPSLWATEDVRVVIVPKQSFVNSIFF